MSAPRFPRDVRGRIISRHCPDPNCGGELVWEADDPHRAGGDAGRGMWRCDGLTHEGDAGPLEACECSVFEPATAKWLEGVLNRAGAAA